jgi:Trypsin-co-occurring domain 1
MGGKEGGEAMAQLIPAKFGDLEIWIEPDQTMTTERGLKKVSVEETAKKAVDLAERLSGTIKAYCSSLIGGVRDLPKEAVPRTVTVEFGLKVSAGGDIYVVKTSGEASLKITAQWQLV